MGDGSVVRSGDSIDDGDGRAPTIDPARLIAALESNGFPRTGGRPGGFVRFGHPGAAQDRPSFLLGVSADISAPEHDEVTRACIRTLRDLADAGARARKVLDTLRGELCEGLTARWCPVHGDCICEDVGDNPGCPLHSITSDHAEYRRGER